jgi:steroid delta-isomerase-like uncharacterized protein
MPDGSFYIGGAMTVPGPSEVVRRWVEAWNAWDPEAVRRLTAPGFVRHDANLPDVVGPDAQMQFVAAAIAAFPDLHFSVNHVVADGALVADHLTGTGTHRGAFLGVPPTGRNVQFQTMETYRITNGQVLEQWVLMDALGLLQQLGAAPSPGPV